MRERPRHGRRGGRLALLVEQDRDHVGARDAVDHRVVELAQQHPAAVGQPLDRPQLPERPRAVELLRHQPRDQPLEHADHEETEPLVDYYEARGLLLRVNGAGTPDEVNTEIREALEAAAPVT